MSRKTQLLKKRITQSSDHVQEKGMTHTREVVRAGHKDIERLIRKGKYATKTEKADRIRAKASSFWK